MKKNLKKISKLNIWLLLGPKFSVAWGPRIRKLHDQILISGYFIGYLTGLGRRFSSKKALTPQLSRQLLMRHISGLHYLQKLWQNIKAYEGQDSTVSEAACTNFISTLPKMIQFREGTTSKIPDSHPCKLGTDSRCLSQTAHLPQLPTEIHERATAGHRNCRRRFVGCKEWKCSFFSLNKVWNSLGQQYADRGYMASKALLSPFSLLARLVKRDVSFRPHELAWFETSHHAFTKH